VRHRTINRYVAGATLPECLISLTLLGLTATGSGTLSINSLQSLQRAQQRLQALYIAADLHSLRDMSERSDASELPYPISGHPAEITTDVSGYGIEVRWQYKHRQEQLLL